MAPQDPVSLAEIRRAIPARLFEKDELRFLVSVGQSVSFTLVLMYLGKTYIPLTWYMLPVWLVFACVTGTVWTGQCIALPTIQGMLGHDCGHGAFSKHKILNDILGYILHTTLLVPYFSWQHSHSVHHAKTNHLTEGESHVPYKADHPRGQWYEKYKEIVGPESFAILNLITISLVGFPLYLLAGYSGGPARGKVSHFIVPNELFPPRTYMKVHISTLGLLAVFYGLYLWAQATSFAEVLAIYVGPYLVVNAWLTLITLLHHTHTEVPHYDDRAWTWLRGALGTIDRNYPPFIDALHHQIGTTHVLHHVFSDIPHYNCKEANEYFKQVVGQYYNCDNKSILASLKNAGPLVVVEHKGEGVWKYRA